MIEKSDKIENLDLHIQQITVLKNKGINTIQDLTQLTEHEFLSIKNIGLFSLIHVMRQLYPLGIFFKKA